MTQSPQFDVLILGAGLSGIGAACHLTRKLPHKSYAILERRDAIGGTWDLFRYPGIRSDSDMSTFGYNFRPWREPKVLADGPSIKRYVSETAQQYDVIPKIRFGRKMVHAAWSSSASMWTITTHREGSDEVEQWTARHIITATGYYNYDAGYTPDYPGLKRYKGRLVHPQHWPEDLDCAGKKVVVIGSGATAITLVPSLARLGAKVTMLQRSPTYVVSVPAIDPLWSKLSRFLPARSVYTATRARNIGMQRALYVASRERPRVVRRLLRRLTKRQLGNKVDLKHFSPAYNPWDERLCVVPDGDLFRVLRRGQAQIVTDTIKSFDAKGITLDSGDHLDADVVVSATGLDLQLFGGAAMSIDGEPVEISERMAYKGMMIEGIPNMLVIFGYTNASWTLKADIVCEHYCRLITLMDKRKASTVTPQANGAQRTDDTIMGSLSSGYVRRGADRLPRQGNKAPWAVLNDYLRDAATLKFGRVKSKALQIR